MGQQARRRLLLKEFVFKVILCTGTHHHGANEITRHPRAFLEEGERSKADTDNGISTWCNAEQVSNVKDVLKIERPALLDAPSALGYVTLSKHIHSSSTQPKLLEFTAPLTVVDQGSICRKEHFHGALQVTVFVIFWQAVLNVGQKPVTAGHQGPRKMYNDHQRKSYWPHMAAGD